MKHHNLEQLTMATLDKAFIIMRLSLDKSSYEWPTHIYDRIDAISFTVNEKSRTKAFGRCWYSKGHIELNPHNFQHQRLNDFVDTVLHEYAHFITYLLYSKTGHCKEWKQICRVIGCDPMATHDK